MGRSGRAGPTAKSAVAIGLALRKWRSTSQLPVVLAQRCQHARTRPAPLDRTGANALPYDWASFPFRGCVYAPHRGARLAARLDRPRLRARGVVEVRFDCRRRATESCGDLGDREPVGFAEVARWRHRLPALEHPVVPSQLSTGGHVSQVLRTATLSPQSRPHASRTPRDPTRVRMSVPRAPSSGGFCTLYILSGSRPRSSRRFCVSSQLGSGPLPIGTRRTSGEPVPRRSFWLPLRVAPRAITNRIRRVRAASESDRAPLVRIEVALRLIGLAHAR